MTYVFIRGGGGCNLVWMCAVVGDYARLHTPPSPHKHTRACPPPVDPTSPCLAVDICPSIQQQPTEWKHVPSLGSGNGRTSTVEVLLDRVASMHHMDRGRSRGGGLGQCVYEEGQDYCKVYV